MGLGTVTVGRPTSPASRQAASGASLKGSVGRQAIFYVSRERRHLWSSRPGSWLIASSILDITLFSTLSTQGILMAPLPATIVACVFGAAVVLAFCLDTVKVILFRRLAIA